MTRRITRQSKSLPTKKQDDTHRKSDNRNRNKERVRGNNNKSNNNDKDDDDDHSTDKDDNVTSTVPRRSPRRSPRHTTTQTSTTVVDDGNKKKGTATKKNLGNNQTDTILKKDNKKKNEKSVTTTDAFDGKTKHQTKQQQQKHGKSSLDEIATVTKDKTENESSPSSTTKNGKRKRQDANHEDSNAVAVAAAENPSEKPTGGSDALNHQQDGKNKKTSTTTTTTTTTDATTTETVAEKESAESKVSSTSPLPASKPNTDNTDATATASSAGTPITGVDAGAAAVGGAGSVTATAIVTATAVEGVPNNVGESAIIAANQTAYPIPPVAGHYFPPPPPPGYVFYHNIGYPPHPPAPPSVIAPIIPPVYIPYYPPPYFWTNNNNNPHHHGRTNNNNARNGYTVISPMRKVQLASAAAKEKYEWIPPPKWDAMFELLTEFKDDFGDCNVPTKEDHPRLRGKYILLLPWAIKQRKMLYEQSIGGEEDEDNGDDDSSCSSASSSRKTTNRSKVLAERKRKLLELGFGLEKKMSRRKRTWEENFALLEEYKNEFGNCNIPTERQKDQLKEKYHRLTSWASKQRTELRKFEKNSKQENLEMNAARKKKLLRLGFQTDIKPPKKSPSEGSATEERPTKKSRLAGFSNFDNAFWNKFNEIKAYKEKHGNLDFPPRSKNWDWLKITRRRYRDLQEGKETNLTLGHVEALTNLGIQLTIPGRRFKKQSMRKRVEEYVEFVKKHGRFPFVHANDKDERSLCQSSQLWKQKRRLFAEGVKRYPGLGDCDIPQDLIEKLDAIEFKWETRKRNSPKKLSPPVPWETKFEQLKAYKAKHGHCEPPKRHPKLGQFAYSMRRLYKFKQTQEGSNSMLTDERYQKLKEIGFRFECRTDKKPQRYVDGDSSGYDTPTDEEDNRKKDKNKASDDDDDFVEDDDDDDEDEYKDDDGDDDDYEDDENENACI